MSGKSVQYDRASRIFLLGFMGCGKSTIGPLVARRIGFGFIDLDDEIEKLSGRKIAVLFNEIGESGFREIESRELTRVSAIEDTVISCGGGIVTIAGNRAIIGSRGLSVYLHVDSDMLVRRLASSTDRPMLYGADGTRLSGTELEERIKRLIAARERYYREADLLVDVTELSVKEATTSVLELMAGADYPENNSI